MTQKRRVIYMTDQEWARLTATAKGEGITISALIRRVSTAPTIPPVLQISSTEVGAWFEGGTGRRMTQAEKDAILNRKGAE